MNTEYKEIIIQLIIKLVLVVICNVIMVLAYYFNDKKNGVKGKAIKYEMIFFFGIWYVAVDFFKKLFSKKEKINKDFIKIACISVAAYMVFCFAVPKIVFPDTEKRRISLHITTDTAIPTIQGKRLYIIQKTDVNIPSMKMILLMFVNISLKVPNTRIHMIFHMSILTATVIWFFLIIFLNVMKIRRQIGFGMIRQQVNIICLPILQDGIKKEFSVVDNEIKTA